MTAWTPTKGSHRPQRAAALLQCHVVPAIRQGSRGTQCQSCLLWSDTGGTRAKYLPCCEASRHKPRASVPEQQRQMLFRGTGFIRESLTAGYPSPALCTLTARLGLFTLDPVQNTETPPSPSPSQLRNSFSLPVGVCHSSRAGGEGLAAIVLLIRYSAVP